MANPAKFIREVRQETKKVAWPTRKEVVVSTITIIVLVVLASIFFMLVDGIISTAVEWLLGLGN
jgi:preprotein translocase subunit SecE